MDGKIVIELAVHDEEIAEPILLVLVARRRIIRRHDALACVCLERHGRLLCWLFWLCFFLFHFWRSHIHRELRRKLRLQLFHKLCVFRFSVCLPVDGTADELRHLSTRHDLHFVVCPSRLPRDDTIVDKLLCCVITPRRCIRKRAFRRQRRRARAKSRKQRQRRRQTFPFLLHILASPFVNPLSFSPSREKWPNLPAILRQTGDRPAKNIGKVWPPLA